MSTKTTPKTEPQYLEKPVFIVHLEGGQVVSVSASSLKEAVKMAKEKANTDEEKQ